jgi:hypothetical protein
VTNGRKKKHHAHELGDPYAEGWAAREAWDGLTEKPVNPYPEIRAIEAGQWADGWRDWEEDFEKDDLDEVVPADFRNLGKRPTPPRREEDYD